MPDDVPERSPALALRREIAGQGAAVTATLADPALRGYVERLAGAVTASGELLVTGMGASLHAGLVLAALLRARGLRAWGMPASELLHYGANVPVGPTLVLSQSGASVEVERLLERRESGTYGLTLDPSSPLGRFGAGVVPGGPERAYAATRSFTSTLAALLGLARRLGTPVRLGRLAGSVAAALVRAHDEETLAEAGVAAGVGTAGVGTAGAGVADAVDALARVEALFVTGRGPLYPLAEYVALLLMELARIPCAALETAQFRHGPREAAGPALGVVALAARNGTGALVRKFAAELAEAGSPTVLLDAGPAEAGPADAGSGRALAVPLPAAGEVAALLPLAVAAQGLAVRLAEARGVTPGAPLRSSKVTREE